MDLRARVCVNSTICNYQLLSIPTKDSHTDKEYFHAMRRMLISVAGEQWNEKLLSVATYGAQNMVARFQGVVTSFEEAALPGFLE